MIDSTSRFGTCDICDGQSWSLVYHGSVRDGVFGQVREDVAVGECLGCGVCRLEESACLQDNVYESAEYRQKLKQPLDVGGYFATHDQLQLFSLEALWPRSLRGLTVADVGCGGGSFLDHVSGVASKIIAVEPSSIYRRALTERGFDVFDYAASAAEQIGPTVDFVVSFQVIEHVKDPVGFLADIRKLLRPMGRVLISTPNRRDILMDLLPDDFPSFFYRVVHRWYFDAQSLSTCAARAGLQVTATKHVHRYGLSNAMAWLRDRRPTGRKPMVPIDGTMDAMWRAWLESTGRSDALYMILARDDSGALADV